jgi:cytochrome c oxidase subunit III
MTQASPVLHEPFESRVRQREAMIFGIWMFLASELLLFGGMFFAFYIYKHDHPGAFEAAAKHTNLLYGTINTALLLTSSFVMSVAGRALEVDRRRLAELCVWATLLLGLAFLLTKGLEYRQDLEEHLWPNLAFDGREPAERIFFGFYWTMTFIHSCHLTIGLFLLARLGIMARTGVLQAHSDSVETTSLYWHIVDVVWIMVFTTLYLVGK